MNLHTRKKVSLLYLVKGQLIILSHRGWQNHRRVCPDTLSGRLFAGTIEPRIHIGWDRASIHLATTWITRDARPQQATQPLTADFVFLLLEKSDGNMRIIFHLNQKRLWAWNKNKLWDYHSMLLYKHPLV